MNSSNTILIKLQSIQIRNEERYIDSYFSFCAGQVMYFSSTFTEKTKDLYDDIVMQISGQVPSTIEVHRWQNHMILFSHSIDVGELKNKHSTKKKIETRSGEILSLTVSLLDSTELFYNAHFNRSISQHYLILSNLHLQQQLTINSNKHGPSYFFLKTARDKYVVPLTDGIVCLKLPEVVKFGYVKLGMIAAESEPVSSDKLVEQKSQVAVKFQGKTKGTLCMTLQWGVNMQNSKAENTLLLQAHEILIYDMEVRFENQNQFGNSRVKFAYGNKGYEVGSQFSGAKITKIKKIIYFIVKTDEEEIKIIVEKNQKIVCVVKFETDQIQSYTVTQLKKKLIDGNGRQIGSIKFKTEKAKNLSTPLNNKFWKETLKKKTLNSALLSIDQVSVMRKRDDSLSVVIKTDNEEWMIPDIPNIRFFQERDGPTPGVVVSAKHEESVYLMVKETKVEGELNQGDFLGIALLNTTDLRMGINCVEIPCFKNQEPTLTIICLVNKVIPYPFIKPNFQPQVTSNQHRTLTLSLSLPRMQFTPYYYTYRYDNKNQVYCIVDINGRKKVLIMENPSFSELSFISADSSDQLNFAIDYSDVIKVKIVCLVSDIGVQEEIYGTLSTKIKVQDLHNVKLENIELKNDYETIVGFLDINIETKNSSVPAEEVQQQIGIRKQKKVPLQRKNSAAFSIEKSKRAVNPIRHSQNHSLDLKSLVDVKKSGQRYDSLRSPKSQSIQESIKLPIIKQAKKSQLKELVHVMKVRKRSMKGYDESNSLEEYGREAMVSGRKEIGLTKIERENPNLERNLQILFPSRLPKVEHSYKKKTDYNEKLKGLKSVLDEISHDMGEIQPTSTNKQSRELSQKPDFNGVQWEGNQFAG